MDQEFIDMIERDFAPELRETAKHQFFSLELKHVMAESEHNLRNARLAVLYLANGKLEVLEEMIHCAKIDFRDVILWASEERKKVKK